MLAAVDMRTVLTLLVIVVSAAAQVVMLKAELKGIKQLFDQHTEQDATSFQDLRSQVAELRSPLLQHRQELVK